MTKKRTSKKTNKNYDPSTDPNNLNVLSRSGLYQGGYSQRRTRYDDVTTSDIVDARVLNAVIRQGSIGENVANLKARRISGGQNSPITEEDKRIIRNRKPKK